MVLGALRQGLVGHGVLVTTPVGLTEIRPFVKVCTHPAAAEPDGDAVGAPIAQPSPPRAFQ